MPCSARQGRELAERRQRLDGAHRISVRFLIAATRPRWDHAGLGKQADRPLRRQIDDLGIAGASSTARAPTLGGDRIESVFGVLMRRS